MFLDHSILLIFCYETEARNKLGITVFQCKLIYKKIAKFPLDTIKRIYNQKVQNLKQITRFFCKQHFYKQHQAEIGKKSSKC